MDRRLIPVLAAAALCACTTLPPAAPWPPEDAPSVVRVHDPGTALGADADVAVLASPVAWDPASCLSVRVRVLWLARLPDHLLRPLTTRTRLLVAEGPSPLEATPLASRGARVQVFACAEALEAALAKLEADLGPRPRDEGDADPVRPAGITTLDALAGALPPGVSVGIEAHGGGGALTAVRVHRPRPIPSPLPPGHPLARTPSGSHAPLDVGFVVRVARPALPGAQQAPAPEETTGERILLERLPWSDRLFLLALLPSPTIPAGGADAVRPGLAFAIEVGPAPAPDEPGWSAHRLAVAECAGDVARATTVRASLASEPRTPEENPAPDPASHAVPPPLERLDVHAERRRALLELAMATGAGLTADVATSGGELLLDDVVARVRRATSAAAAPTLGPALGWLVERVTLTALADAVAEADPGSGRLSEVGALLARRVGGLSLRPSALLAAAATSADQAAWLAALVTENRVLLEDGDAAVRARAFDWLDARGLAPGAYDPFGPLAARRAALDRADEAEAARRQAAATDARDAARSPALEEAE